MTRKFAPVLLIIALIFALSLPAFAAETTPYFLDDLGLTVSIPSDLVTFTRVIDENDPNLAAYGWTKEDFLSFMQTSSIYLNAWDEGGNFEIVVTMMESPISDFNAIGDAALSILASSLAPEYEAAGITYITSEIYQSSQTKFIKIYFSQTYGDATVNSIQYYTVYAGQAMNFTLHAYSGSVTDYELQIQDIVDSVVFDVPPQIVEVAPTNAFTYTDEGTLLTFTVPANWSGLPLSEDTETIDAKFVSNEDSGACIMYAGTDLWEKLTASERAGYTRAEIDNSIFSIADVAVMYGLSASEVSVETYGDIEYYKAVPLLSGASGELALTVEMTHLIVVKNGYLYDFQFSGTEESEYYKDFESLIMSADYHVLAAPVGGADTGQDEQTVVTDATASSGISNEYTLAGILLSLIITIVIYSLPIIIYRYAVRKAPVAPKKAKKITIIYGIAAAIVMVALLIALDAEVTSFGAIFFWSYVNYKMLTNEKKNGTPNFQPKDTPKETSAYKPNMSAPVPDSTIEEPAQSVRHGEPPADKPPNFEFRDFEPQTDGLLTDTFEPDTVTGAQEIRFCNKCGNKLQPNSTFCAICGAKVSVWDASDGAV